MKKKIAYLTKNMVINGISTVIMNYCRNIDRNKFDITIIAGSPVESSYRDECEKLGVKIKEITPKSENSKKYCVALMKELSGKKYDMIHVHGNSATITVELLIAWLKGIKIRIAHCHNSTCDHVKVHKLLKPLFSLLYNYGFACSKLAGEWMFGNKPFRVIPNGFKVEQFKFNPTKRQEVREKLGVGNELLIGHVGRFNNQKNHPFLLNVFEKTAGQNPGAHLVLVGNGPDYSKIKKLADEHPFKNNIIFYGETDHAEDLYSAMDVFVFPSRYEGLGIVLLEAQISGLPCVISDVIPSEAVISENVTKLSLNDDYRKWADAILSQSNNNGGNYGRKDFFDKNYDQIKQYNIIENAKNIEKLYIEFLH